MRCAVKKYYESGKCDSELDAVQMLIDNHFVTKVGDQFDQNLWRVNNTFNVYVDNAVKAYLKVFEHIYDKFSGKHVLPGAKSKYMMVDEFEDFCCISGVCNDLMTQQLITYLFNISIFTYEDEVKDGKHLQASLIEFIEMCVRVANEGCYGPPVTDDQVIEMSLEERRAQTLQ